MNKFLLLSSIVALALGVGVLYLLIVGGTTSKSSLIQTEEGPESVPTTYSETKPFSGVGSIADLLARSEDLECKLSFSENPDSNLTSREGTLFTSRGRLRVDVLIDEFNQVGVASVIIRDSKFYSWIDFTGQRTGIQTPLSDMSDNSVGGTGSVSVNDDVNYDCRVWSPVDGSIFEIPNDILFTSISLEAQPVMEDGRLFQSENTPAESCKVCQAIPAGSARESCLVSLSCI